MILNNRVRELRTRMNLRQSDLAREVAVTRQTILSIEKGRLNPSIMICLKIARILREPVDYVFYLTPEENPDWASSVTHVVSTGATPGPGPVEPAGELVSNG